jgi:hypothetical protein
VYSGCNSQLSLWIWRNIKKKVAHLQGDLLKPTGKNANKTRPFSLHVKHAGSFFIVLLLFVGFKYNYRTIPILMPKSNPFSQFLLRGCSFPTRFMSLLGNFIFNLFCSLFGDFFISSAMTRPQSTKKSIENKTKQNSLIGSNFEP